MSIHYKTMKNNLDIDVYLEEKFVFINYHLLARKYQIFYGGDFQRRISIFLIEVKQFQMG